MNPDDVIPGWIVGGNLRGDPLPMQRRGFMNVRPAKGSDGKTKALRVRVMTETGFPVIEMRATQMEVQTIEGPPLETDRIASGTRSDPGTIWFYANDGISEVGFITDAALKYRERPMAIEHPRSGRTPEA